MRLTQHMSKDLQDADRALRRMAMILLLSVTAFGTVALLCFIFLHH